MGRRYSESGANGSNAVTTTNKTGLTIISNTTVRARLYDFSLGASGTPADNVMTYAVQRFTGDGTGTAVTPTALDPGDPAALLTSKSNYSAEPGYTTTLWQLGVNQRASYRWVCAPNSELVVPVTASNGIGFGALSPAYTSTTTFTAMHEE